ncbi:hypothetical protein G7092_21890 [Mucilaginibacter sp. HC2]|uniref:hypothetical protein n=1 Tax=Mucilaginibacter inviolabilis TaxID=2714892 RepID=UPI00140BAA6C|nr:hypothetical protein [Mucilaginibacter inviolabilis]NHA06476.1 hypothetical protein [Mucilaginibacter inviolabilis]
MKHLTILFTFIVFTSLNTKAQLKIYGGKKHDQFLGCMSCNTEDSNSIWSSFGDYGSMHNANSIWNPDGKYGSKTSDFSPFNKNAKYPPVILDRSGKPHGYITINEKFPDRAPKGGMADNICKWRDDIIEDIPGYYDRLYRPKN